MRLAIATAIVLGFSALSSIPVLAQVAPPHFIVAGFTIAEWTARYNQWGWSQSTNQHPYLDTDGSWANNGQAGPVFFIAGGFYLGPQPARHYTVPQDKYLLLPLVTIYVDNIDVFPPLPVEELLAIAAAHIDTTTEMHVSIDGMPVSGLFAHRETAPPFTLNLASPDNLFTISYHHDVTGLIDPAVADGYWLMLEPLAPGPHVIVFGGTYGSPESYSYERTDHITVLGPNSAASADATATLKRVISPNNATALVTLDGSRSSDPDQDPLAYRWEENGALLGTGAVTVVTLPVGQHLIHLLVNDSQETSETTATVEVLTAGDVVVELMRAVADTGWKSSEKHPLLNDLAAAGRAFERERFEQGLHHLQLFAKRIAKRMPSQDPSAAALLRASQAIAEALNGASE